MKFHGDNYVEVSQWIHNHFAKGSEPSIKLIRNAVSRGELRGRVIGSKLWVADNALEIPSEPKPSKPSNAQSTTIDRLSIIR